MQEAGRSQEEAGRGSFRGKGDRQSSRGSWFGSDSGSEKIQVLGLTESNPGAGSWAGIGGKGDRSIGVPTFAVIEVSVVCKVETKHPHLSSLSFLC